MGLGYMQEFIEVDKFGGHGTLFLNKKYVIEVLRRQELKQIVKNTFYVVVDLESAIGTELDFII